jgi:4-diphosphocytidyl-2-C-methyl-D-erythritol kinase
MFVTFPAYAKINLSLEVISRRADGYHMLRSVVSFADVGEYVSAEESNDLNLVINGAFAAHLSTTDNIILEVARGFAAHVNHKVGARLSLHKTMPIASGIGGGSSDAAATLHCLNHLWGCKLSLEALQAFALPYGADIPACLYAKPCIMEGIGNIITPYEELPQLHAVLINPMKAVSTQSIFRALPAQLPCPALILEEDIHKMRNDLQPYAITQCEEIAHTLALLAQQPACKVARMSGSGATCYGLFECATDAQTSALSLQNAFPNYWVRAITLKN